jgi:hypothetical protein
MLPEFEHDKTRILCTYCEHLLMRLIISPKVTYAYITSAVNVCISMQLNMLCHACLRFNLDTHNRGLQHTVTRRPTARERVDKLVSMEVDSWRPTRYGTCVRVNKWSTNISLDTAALYKRTFRYEPSQSVIVSDCGHSRWHKTEASRRQTSREDSHSQWMWSQQKTD